MYVAVVRCQMLLTLTNVLHDHDSASGAGLALGIAMDNSKAGWLPDEAIKKDVQKGAPPAG